MRKDDDITKALTGLMGILGNMSKQDSVPPHQEPSQTTHGIFIKKEGGKNLEQIILTTAFDHIQKYSSKNRSEKSAAAKTTDSPTTHSGDSSASYPEKDSKEEGCGNQRTRCFDEVVASAVEETKSPLLSSIVPTADANIIHVMVPGVEKEDLDLSIESGLITVSTSSKKEEVSDEEHFSAFTAFNSSVSFEIDEDKFDMENIKAVHKNGVLTITVPLKEQPKSNPRKVDIL